MLSNNDLEKIGSLVDQKLTPIHEELKEHGKLLREHGTILKQHSKQLRSLKKDQDTMLKMLDRERLDHLHLPSAL
jgi:hypothetical protein